MLTKMNEDLEKEVPPFDKQAMIDYTKDFNSPNQEISQEFIDSLSAYSQMIGSLSVDEIKEFHPEIPKILKNIQKNSLLCLDQGVTDCLADSYLSFIMGDSDETIQWAADQIRSRNAIYFSNPITQSLSPQIVFEQISNNPKEYFASITIDSLKAISKGELDETLVPYLLEELQIRELEIPDHLFYTSNLNPSNLSPQLFVKYFLLFVDTPTIQISSLVFNSFIERPTLHLLCIKEAIKVHKSKVLRALEMIGKQLKSNFPLPFHLSFLYHPYISNFVNEVEYCALNPDSLNPKDLLEILNTISGEYIYFIIPLLMELPAWLEKIQAVCPPCYERITSIMTFMFSEHSNI